MEHPDDADGPGARSRFLEGLSQALVASGRVLVVDDAHWIDEGSLDVLAYTARRRQSRQLSLLLTWRPEEVPPGHALRNLLGHAQRAGSATVISLERLEQEDVIELARAAGADELGDRLFEETAGLPLFVVEYLAAAAEAGDGEWPLPGSIAGAARRPRLCGERDRAAASGRRSGTRPLVRRGHGARRQRPQRGGGRRCARGADEAPPRRRGRGRVRLRP